MGRCRGRVRGGRRERERDGRRKGGEEERKCVQECDVIFGWMDGQERRGEMEEGRG